MLFSDVKSALVVIKRSEGGVCAPVIASAEAGYPDDATVIAKNRDSVAQVCRNLCIYEHLLELMRHTAGAIGVAPLP